MKNNNYREFDDEVYEKIEKALDDVKNGRYKPIEEYIANINKRYGINGITI